MDGTEQFYNQVGMWCAPPPSLSCIISICPDVEKPEQRDVLSNDSPCCLLKTVINNKLL